MTNLSYRETPTSGKSGGDSNLFNPILNDQKSSSKKIGALDSTKASPKCTNSKTIKKLDSSLK
jgi:hypothetical protein